MHLARNIVSLYHSPEDVREAEINFQALYQNKNFTNIELPIIVFDEELLDENSSYSLIDCIYSAGRFKSKSEVRRLIQQGAVKLNGIKITDFMFQPQDDMIVQVGRGNFFRILSLTKIENNSLKLVKKDK